jgi:hypothetical protein
MPQVPCPYLHGDVELTDERERHIATHHPDLVPEHSHCIAETLAEPDEVRIDADYPNTRLFLRWYEDLRAGKYVAVALMRSPVTQTRICTAHSADGYAMRISTPRRSR